MKIRNKTDQEQAFTGIPVFAPGEERDVSDEVGEYLCGSPHMECVDGSEHHESKKKSSRSFKGIEAE